MARKRDPILKAADELEPRMTLVTFSTLKQLQEDASIEAIAAAIANKRVTSSFHDIESRLEPIGVMRDRAHVRGREIGSRKVKALRA